MSIETKSRLLGSENILIQIPDDDSPRISPLKRIVRAVTLSDSNVPGQSLREQMLGKRANPEPESEEIRIILEERRRRSGFEIYNPDIPIDERKRRLL